MLLIEFPTIEESLAVSDRPRPPKIFLCKGCNAMTFIPKKHCRGLVLRKYCYACAEKRRRCRSLQYYALDRKTEGYRIRRKKYQNSGKGQASIKKRTYLLAEIKHDFTAAEWEAKVKALTGICPGCKRKIDPAKFTLDHILPVSRAPRGFVYTINDVQPLCGGCNSRKADALIFPAGYKPNLN